MPVIAVFNNCLDLKRNDGSWLNNSRNRRESIVGLIPFPRVGRSNMESNPRNMDSLCECEIINYIMHVHICWLYSLC